MEIRIPAGLAANCQRSPEAAAWLSRVPDVLWELQSRWRLTPGEPFGSVSSLVLPVGLEDGADAVLKLGMPHFEAEHEIQGLRFWAGDAVVRLLDSDTSLDAMLLERCKPGSALQSLPESAQDDVIASLLRRLWREPPASDPFRPLATVLSRWTSEALAARSEWLDANLVEEGLRLFEELPQTSPANVLLATDLHAGNVLRAGREPWLMIDPKPFVGDPAYDATQHLLNCADRLRSDPGGTIGRFAELLEVDAGRVARWTFARAAAAPWAWNDEWLAVARALAPGLR